MTAADGVLRSLERLRVLPVVEVERAADAVPLAHTLLEAGLPVVELTLRTPVALEAIEHLCKQCPDILVGAGTLLNAEMVRNAANAGAAFGVAPGLHAASLDAAAQAGLPFVPGVVTPSEVMVALDSGLRHLKFFPAGANGGTSALSALAAPLTMTGVRFMPTGGITVTNASEYLALPSVFAVGGTWIAPRADIAAGRWRDIADRARAAVALAAPTSELSR